MTKYNKIEYENLIKELGSQYHFQIEKVHDDAYELLAAPDAPVFRVLYESTHGLVILCFQVLTPSTKAIQIFNSGQSLLPDLSLGDVYYVTQNAELVIGEDAYLHYEAELEDYYINKAAEQQIAAEYTSEVPITITSPYPLYESQHPQAKDQNLEYRKRLALFQGKRIEDD